MIFAEAPLANVSSGSLEIEGRCIEKDEVQPGIEVTVGHEEPFLGDILCASGSKWSGVVLVVSLLPEKGHGTVEVMKLDLICPVYEIVPAPLVAEAVRAARHKPVDHGQEKRSLYVEKEKPLRKKPFEDLSNPQLFPQPLEMRAGPIFVDWH